MKMSGMSATDWWRCLTALLWTAWEQRDVWPPESHGCRHTRHCRPGSTGWFSPGRIPGLREAETVCKCWYKWLIAYLLILCKIIFIVSIKNTPYTSFSSLCLCYATVCGGVATLQCLLHRAALTPASDCLLSGPRAHTTRTSPPPPGVTVS